MRTIPILDEMVMLQCPDYVYFLRLIVQEDCLPVAFFPTLANTAVVLVFSLFLLKGLDVQCANTTTPYTPHQK